MGYSPQVILINQAKTSLGLDLSSLAVALQSYVNDHVSTYWGYNCTVAVGSAFGPGQWPIFFVDTDSSVPDALGYHDIEANDEPYGKILVKTTLDAGDTLSSCVSHELAEMLGDSRTNKTVQWSDGSFYALELCDAVEQSEFAVNGFQMSNFVTPQWFWPNEKNGPFDYLKQCKSSGELLPGGYISKFVNGQWTQSFGSDKTEAKFVINEHHRIGLRHSRKMATNIVAAPSKLVVPTKSVVVPKKDNKGKNNKKGKKSK